MEFKNQNKPDFLEVGVEHIAKLLPFSYDRLYSLLIPAFYEKYKFNWLGIVEKNYIISGRKVPFLVLPNFI